MEKEEWSNVDVANAGQEDQIEIEFEEPQEEEKPQVQAQEEEKKEEVVEEKPPELEGIETKGAEKRIMRLLYERKQRDEHIQALIQKK